MAGRSNKLKVQLIREKHVDGSHGRTWLRLTTQNGTPLLATSKAGGYSRSDDALISLGRLVDALKRGRWYIETVDLPASLVRKNMPTIPRRARARR